MRLLYTGPSLLDPAVPIFVAATGPSTNRKTGSMTQVWILRADQHPVGAVKNHTDAAICGSCRHRGLDGQTRTCYVNVAWAPAAIYRAFVDKRYTDQQHAPWAFADQMIRVGAYGDPAALPIEWWEDRLHHAKGWTGYTHQWELPRFLRGRFLFMASVDTIDEQRRAHALSWRTFRVRTETSPLLPNEITCPASAEAGKRTTCAKCLLCAGLQASDIHRHRRKDIAILAHGADAAFEAQQQGRLDL